MVSIIRESTVSYLFTICYDCFQKVGMLKLLEVLTCKKFPCVNIACAHVINLRLLCATRGRGHILLIFRVV